MDNDEKDCDDMRVEDYNDQSQYLAAHNLNNTQEASPDDYDYGSIIATGGGHRASSNFRRHVTATSGNAAVGGSDYEDDYQGPIYPNNNGNQIGDLTMMLDGDIKVPGLIGRSSIEPKDKGNFYMTQMLN